MYGADGARHVPVGVGDYRVFDAHTQTLLYPLHPLDVGMHLIDRQADQLAVQAAEPFVVEGEGGELGRAHRSEVARMAEQDEPFSSEVVGQSHRAQGRADLYMREALADAGDVHPGVKVVHDIYSEPLVVQPSERFEYGRGDAALMSAAAQPAVQLRWERNGTFAHDYTLRGNGATLRFPKLMSARAQGSIGDRSYTFDTKGIVRREVTVLQDPFDQEAATMRLSRGGGTLELMDGRRFVLVREGMLKLSWSFRDDRGRELISFKMAFQPRVGSAAAVGDGRQAPSSSPRGLVRGHPVLDRMGRH